MGLVTGKIPNLVSGVSQQPPALRASSQCTEAENAALSLVEGLKKRSGTQFRARLSGINEERIKVHLINRDLTERYVVVLLNGDLKVYDINGVEKEVHFPQGKAYLASANPLADFKLVTVADYTFVVNKAVTVRLASKVTPIRPDEALIWMKYGGGADNIAFKVIIDGSVVCSYSNPATQHAGAQLSTLYTKLTAALNSAVWRVSWDVEGNENRVLWLRRADAGPFSFHASDSTNTWIHYCKGEVQNFEDLPTTAPDGFVAHVVGAPTTKFDDYYVRFVADVSGGISKGLWKECAKPGVQYALDETTMPHVLIRNADGSFTFKPSEWDPRLVGDDDSNPPPSFVGRQINDIFFYHNRLCFLSDENCIMSEAGAFFNFWRTTVLTVVDSDPIDVAVSTNKVSILQHAVPFQDLMMVFTDQTQFYLDHDDVLSGATLSIKPLTEFSALQGVRPIAAGNNVYFAAQKGDSCGIWEYYLDPKSGVKDALEITKHVPSYIPATVSKLTAAPGEGLIAVLTTGAPDTVFIYRFYWQGEDKLQSAWSRWVFDGGKILDAEFIDTMLFMVVRYGAETMLLTLPCEETYADPGVSWDYHLDRKISNTQFSAVSYADGVTTITLPYNIPDNVEWQLITRPAQAGEIQPYPAGLTLPFSKISDNVIQVEGDHRTTPLYFGNLYTMRYEFSPLYLRELSRNGGEVIVTNGRLQLRKWDIVYAPSGYFKVLVTPKLKASRTYICGDILADNLITLGKKSINSGIFSVPIYSQSMDVKVEIVNHTYWPCRLLAVEWEGFYTARAERSGA